MPGQTSDPSVLQVSSSSKLLIDLREDALAVMENLVLENTSDRIFNPGPGGLRIPLPAGSSSGSPIEGGARLEANESSTMLLRDAIPPTSLAMPVQARFGFFIPTAGESRITLRQPMPFGIESPVVMVPEGHHLSITAPGLQAVAPQPDDRGGRIQIFQLASVPRNGVLSISVSGLPTRGSLGKTDRDGAGCGACFRGAARVCAGARSKHDQTIAARSSLPSWSRWNVRDGSTLEPTMRS